MEITYRTRKLNGEFREDTTFEFAIAEYMVYEIFSDKCIVEIYECSSHRRMFKCQLMTGEYFFSDKEAEKYLNHILELLDVGKAEKKARKAKTIRHMSKVASGAMDSDAFIAQCVLQGISGAQEYTKCNPKDTYTNTDVEELSRQQTDHASAKAKAITRELGNPTKHPPSGAVIIK